MSQNRLNFVEPGEPGFEPETIARYRVALVREEATPYESPEHWGDPAAAARFLHTILSSWDREVMGALFLDTRNRAIGHQLAYIGTLTRAAVEPRGILTAALLANAAGILLFHNHPSGDPSPRTWPSPAAWRRPARSSGSASSTTSSSARPRPSSRSGSGEPFELHEATALRSSVSSPVALAFATTLLSCAP